MGQHPVSTNKINQDRLVFSGSQLYPSLFHFACKISSWSRHFLVAEQMHAPGALFSVKQTHELDTVANDTEFNLKPLEYLYKGQPPYSYV